LRSESIAWAPAAGHPELLSVLLPRHEVDRPLTSARYLVLLELRLAMLLECDRNAQEQLRLHVESEGWGEVAGRSPRQAANQLLWFVEPVHEKVWQELHRVDWPVPPPHAENPKAAEVISEGTVESFLLVALPIPERD